MEKAAESKEREIKSKRVSVKDAAAEIGCAPEYLRRQMKSGRWNIGEVVKPDVKSDKKQKKQCEYFIFRAKLDKFLGKEEKEVV